MACALFGGLVYAVLFFPRAPRAFVPPKLRTVRFGSSVAHALVRAASRHRSVRHRWPLIGRPRSAMLVGSARSLRAGRRRVHSAHLRGRRHHRHVARAEHLTRRSPKLDLKTEKVLKELPRSASGRSARASRASWRLDAVGNEQHRHPGAASSRSKSGAPRTTSTSCRPAHQEPRSRPEVPSTFVSVIAADRRSRRTSSSRARARDVPIKIYRHGSSTSSSSSRTRSAIRSAASAAPGDLKIERIARRSRLITAHGRSGAVWRATACEGRTRVRRAPRLRAEGVQRGRGLRSERRSTSCAAFAPAARPDAEALGELFVETERRQRSRCARS